VLNAILSMAGRQDLLLARKVEDLRQKVFELAAIMGEPHSYDSSRSIRVLGVGLARVPGVRGR
jgi:hypothetical protein